MDDHCVLRPKFPARVVYDAQMDFHVLDYDTVEIASCFVCPLSSLNLIFQYCSHFVDTR